MTDLAPATPHQSHAGQQASGPPDRRRDRTEYVREGVYATFTGLALVGVLLFSGSHLSAAEAFGTLTLGVGGIALAGFVADLIAFQVSHRRFPDWSERVMMARTAGAALGTASVPLLAIILAALGWIPIMLALQLSVGIYFATLIAMLLLATRRTGLPRRQQLVSLAMLFGLAIAVLSTLAVAHAL